jgi:serine/threonine protein kinase
MSIVSRFVTATSNHKIYLLRAIESISPTLVSLIETYCNRVLEVMLFPHLYKLNPQQHASKTDSSYYISKSSDISIPGIALDWENLSRSTTTADSGKTLVYAAPEVAHYEKRNSSADVWSLGCVFVEMVTVLKGETIASMRSFLQNRSGNHLFYANIDNAARWAKALQPKGAEKDNAVFGWVRAMLNKDAEKRLTAAEVYDYVVKDCGSLHVPFSGSCCVEEHESSDVEDTDEEDLWERAAELTIVPGESSG